MQTTDPYRKIACSSVDSEDFVIEFKDVFATAIQQW